jgi:WhiB family transcriptional regulator, redox-sensing transcriptional regulator
MALRRDDPHVQHTGSASDGDDWQLQAACRGHDAAAFFAPPHFERKELRLARERFAKAICRGCPVTNECLDYALRTREPHGVWGGLNEFERRHLLPSDRGR